MTNDNTYLNLNSDLLFLTFVILFVFILIIYSINGYNKYSNASEPFTTEERIRDGYRRIYFSETKFYFLTVNNPTRRKHILDEFSEYNPIEINPITGISRNMSGSSGFCRMVDQGLRDQERDKPFQPFILLEDDASKYREFPKYIDIPLDADIVYLGLHEWGYSKDEPIKIVYSEEVDENLIRVKNLLALHGVMICSAAGGALMERCMMETYYRDKPWDIPITHAQPFYRVYALKIPLVYQDKKYDGKEYVTKIKARKWWFKPMPKKHINENGTSNIMGMRPEL